MIPGACDPQCSLGGISIVISMSLYSAPRARVLCCLPASSSAWVTVCFLCVVLRALHSAAVLFALGSQVTSVIGRPAGVIPAVLSDQQCTEYSIITIYIYIYI